MSDPMASPQEQEQVFADTSAQQEHDLARSNLAASYWSAGRNDEAIALEEGVLADRERVLGNEDPATAEARERLVSALWSADRSDEVIAIEERLVADTTETAGADDLDTLNLRSNLDRPTVKRAVWTKRACFRRSSSPTSSVSSVRSTRRPATLRRCSISAARRRRRRIGGRSRFGAWR